MNTQVAMQQAQADQQTATSREHNVVKSIIKQTTLHTPKKLLQDNQKKNLKNN